MTAIHLQRGCLRDPDGGVETQEYPELRVLAQLVHAHDHVEPRGEQPDALFLQGKREARLSSCGHGAAHSLRIVTRRKGSTAGCVGRG